MFEDEDVDADLGGMRIKMNMHIVFGMGYDFEVG